MLIFRDTSDRTPQALPLLRHRSRPLLLRRLRERAKHSRHRGPKLHARAQHDRGDDQGAWRLLQGGVLALGRGYGATGAPCAKGARQTAGAQPDGLRGVSGRALLPRSLLAQGRAGLPRRGEVAGGEDQGVFRTGTEDLPQLGPHLQGRDRRGRGRHGIQRTAHGGCAARAGMEESALSLPLRAQPQPQVAPERLHALRRHCPPIQQLRLGGVSALCRQLYRQDRQTARGGATGQYLHEPLGHRHLATALQRHPRVSARPPRVCPQAGHHVLHAHGGMHETQEHGRGQRARGALVDGRGAGRQHMARQPHAAGGGQQTL